MSYIPSRLMRTPITASLLHGWVDLEETESGIIPHRLPSWARRQWPDQQLAMSESQPSGVCIRLRTAATIVEVEALPTKRVYAGMPPRPEGVYALVIDGVPSQQASIPTGDVIRIDLSGGASSGSGVEIIPGAPGSVRFAGLAASDKQIEIWLPHNEATRLVALYSDAPVFPAKRSDRLVWLHHGSSISQGSNAASPTSIWPSVAATIADVDLLNLSFGGSALLDPFVARTIRDISADRISLKLGINIVNMDLMRLRGFGPAVHGFLDTIREGHADTPLLIVSPILCPMHEHVPGPSAPDFADGEMKFRATGDPAEVAAGRLTLSVIRDALQAVVAQRRRADLNIHYLDGRTLYGEDDHLQRPLPDRLHPDDDTHRLIGQRFADAVFKAAGPLR
ncbi:lipase [Sphingomonas sp. UV9]|uniref:SGNH/GDSL hydrolase family protein n=1 Tax=Sphingomonas sp. UV9 TaxID=1851410 RepID=UPI000FFC170A|nr:SGNH/GDSL hydrolase family protein [Sphingomonas sp. UV9]RXD04763.1 lipase [Sphingomonas sp. UV9]